jgi:hypothetical protein
LVLALAGGIADVFELVADPQVPGVPGGVAADAHPSATERATAASDAWRRGIAEW